MAEPLDGARVLPLKRRDPPAIDQIEVTGRLGETTAGIVYSGRIDDQPVAIALLGVGAETDSYARARFYDAIVAAAEADGQVVASSDEPDIAPWVAVRADSWARGLSTAKSLLAVVTLEDREPIGDVRGPGFRPHWFRSRRPGRWRLWPLPWPVTLTSAGRWTFVAAFALILAIAAIALFIAVKLFDNQPVVPPGPGPQLPIQSPTPSQGRPTPTTTSPSRPSLPGQSGPTVTGRSYPPYV
ncbi:MAG: hypothetical protein ACRDPG_05095 [Nocardioidaceae bacterium]